MMTFYAFKSPKASKWYVVLSDSVKGKEMGNSTNAITAMKINTQKNRI